MALLSLSVFRESGKLGPGRDFVVAVLMWELLQARQTGFMTEYMSTCCMAGTGLVTGCHSESVIMSALGSL